MWSPKLNSVLRASICLLFLVFGVGQVAAVSRMTLRGKVAKHTQQASPLEDDTILLHGYLSDVKAEAELDSRFLDEQLALQHRNHTIFMAVSNRVAKFLRAQLAAVKSKEQWDREMKLQQSLLNSTVFKLNHSRVSAEQLKATALRAEMELAKAQQECLDNSRRRAKILNSLSRMLATQRRRQKASSKSPSLLQVSHRNGNVTAPTPAELKEAFANIIEAVEQNREAAADKCELQIVDLRSSYARSSAGAHKAKTESGLIARDVTELEDMHVHMSRRMRMDVLRRDFLEHRLNETMTAASAQEKHHKFIVSKMENSYDQANKQLDAVAKLQNFMGQHEVMAGLLKST